MLQCPAVREGNALDRRGRFITPKQLFNTEPPPPLLSLNTELHMQVSHLVFAWCRSVADSGVSSCGGLHADIYNDVSIISVSAVFSVSTGFPLPPQHTCLSFQTGCQISCWEVQSDSPRKKKKMWPCEIHYDSFRGPSLSFIGDQTCKQSTFLYGTKQVLLQPKYGTKQSLIPYNKYLHTAHMQNEISN